MENLEPITRTEHFLARAAGNQSAATLTPITREEHFMARAAGNQSAATLTPITREEHFLQDIIDNGSGSDGGEAVLIQKTITANGTFAAADDNADGYSSVTVDVQGGGGGGLDDYFTPVNCVTIRNDATYGYTNGFLIPEVAWNVVKRIEIKFKLADPSAAHFIWAASEGKPYLTKPFIDKTTVSGVGTGSSSVITNEIVGGITHYVLALNSTASSKFWIGSWSDATYSKTATYYELKMWDVNDNLLVDLQPSVSVVGNLPSFLNKVSGVFYSPTTSFIAGEVLS